MKILLVLYLLLAVPVVVAVLAASRRARSSAGQRSAAEARELQACRELIDRLLATAVDHRDVDPVLAPIVIEEIRSHQRHLSDRRDPGTS